MWLAGLIAALGTISYPSISAFVSNHASPEQQGAAQGIVTGIRGLCMGLGPLLYGFIFSLFRIDPMSLDTHAIVQSVIRAEYVLSSVPLARLLVQLFEIQYFRTYSYSTDGCTFVFSICFVAPRVSHRMCRRARYPAEYILLRKPFHCLSL